MLQVVHMMMLGQHVITTNTTAAVCWRSWPYPTSCPRLEITYSSTVTACAATALRP